MSKYNIPVMYEIYNQIELSFAIIFTCNVELWVAEIARHTSATWIFWYFYLLRSKKVCDACNKHMASKKQTWM
jgi:hypothetical protein